jgi:GNAT superfamily N-acetyltransferase
LPRPPSPQDENNYWAFVYNVYTKPDHRGRGLARRIMETIHAWCRARGLKTVALNASEFGLYMTIGHQQPTFLKQPEMIKTCRLPCLTATNLN